MSSITSITWEQPPHSIAKHTILEKYLAAWFSILGMSESTLNFIDGFCGPGVQDGGTFGSPIIALNIAKKVKMDQNRKLGSVNFYFIDSNKNRINTLRNKIESDCNKPKEFKFFYMLGEFEEFVTNLFSKEMKSNRILGPTFAFIDPFGISGVTFNSVKRILENDKSEVFINIMVESANRWINHPNDKIHTNIELLFGTNEVYKIPQMSNVDRIEEFRSLYLRQIRQCAKYVYDFEMRGNNDKRLYYLFFATNNKTGIKKMKEACWSVDKIRGKAFSDREFEKQYQRSLFSDECLRFFDLSEIILDKFSSGTYAIQEIEDYVLYETNYLPSHMRYTLKCLEKEGRITVMNIKTDGSKRHGKTFSENVRVIFP